MRERVYCAESKERKRVVGTFSFFFFEEESILSKLGDFGL
jgi:hypothetical protein